jgi:UPF0755 protein
MIDDLDLAWEEQNEPRRRGAPPTRQVRQRRRKERKRRRRSFGALLISVLLLAALGGGVYWGVGKLQEMLGADDYTGNPGTVAVNVTVNEGDSATAIGTELYDKKVVKSVKAFVNAADANPASRTIQPGIYKLFEQSPAAVALAMLLDPEKNMVVDRVTIREGLTAIQTFKVLAKETGIPEKDFKAAAKDPLELGVPEWWFSRSDDKTAKESIEGFLFPDTYVFPPDASAEDILKIMVNQFNTVVGELNFAEKVQNDLGISPFEALVVASLAQVEAGKEADMPKVARVAYNRAVKEGFPCRCLQFDVTANYYLEQQGKKTKASKDMTAAELDNPRNPWNTGPSTPGLPVGPISNPGKAALEGAMDPPSEDWVYFVAVDDKGTTKFASTAAQHDRNVAEACRNGVLNC